MTWMCFGGVELEEDEKCRVCGDTFEDRPFIHHKTKIEKLKEKNVKHQQIELFV